MRKSVNRFLVTVPLKFSKVFVFEEIFVKELMHVNCIRHLLLTIKKWNIAKLIYFVLIN